MLSEKSPIGKAGSKGAQSSNEVLLKPEYMFLYVWVSQKCLPDRSEVIAG
jgi:hypothetical protein